MSRRHAPGSSRLLRLAVLIVLAGAVYLGQGAVAPARDSSSDSQLLDDGAIARAFAGRVSDLQVGGSGIVTRLLADDLEGGRHQRFILRLGDGQTLLVAHNIDLAPRINTITVGDRVEFFGEYEWSAPGGVLHWTHHDPAGRHVGGWLEHAGRRYE